MPPNQSRLPDEVIGDLTAWVRMGAPDPRDGPVQRVDKVADWEVEFQNRLDWWSLKPVIDSGVPEVKRTDWPRTDVDRFILARLEENGLQPAPEAARHTLARRLSFALTGLPPEPQLLARFTADGSPQAYDNLVTALLDSPHFGERWARHWMDVVHYSDTHGYEWDVPAKHAWRYRDYLIRAFNADIPYCQLVLEQIAGDLVAPRLDPATGLNESLIGPMMLRLGERRHGDNAAAEGVTQEAVANMIDTLGKAFLGTTLACAQCHDHKFDAIEQRDFYSLAGMLMSTRFSARPVDATDPNLAVIDELRHIKGQIRGAISKLWLEATDTTKSGGAVDTIKAIPADETQATSFPTSLVEFWKRSLNSPITADAFRQERERRISANRTNLTQLADFTYEEGAAGWRWEGFGMKHGLVTDGEPVIADEGDFALQHLLPAGRFSHVWSQRLAGSLHSPQFDPTDPVTLSVELVSGKFASQAFIVDRAIHPERMVFPNRSSLGWQTLTAGNFDSLEGSIDSASRLVYLEFATKSLNNYFPPRVGYGGVGEEETADPRAWFGATHVVAHPPDFVPQDELGRFVSLFDEGHRAADWPERLIQLVRTSVERWCRGECNSEDVRLLNDALQLKLLPHELGPNPELHRWVEKYRAEEKKLQPDRTIGSVADWNEGCDAQIGIRGSYTDLGDPVGRGNVRFLGEAVPRAVAVFQRATGMGTTHRRRTQSVDRSRLRQPRLALPVQRRACADTRQLWPPRRTPNSPRSTRLSGQAIRQRWLVDQETDSIAGHVRDLATRKRACIAGVRARSRESVVASSADAASGGRSDPRLDPHGLRSHRSHPVRLAHRTVPYGRRRTEATLLRPTRW